MQRKRFRNFKTAKLLLYAIYFTSTASHFKRQPRIMVKYTQTICLSVFDHVVRLVFKELRKCSMIF